MIPKQAAALRELEAAAQMAVDAHDMFPEDFLIKYGPVALWSGTGDESWIVRLRAALEKYREPCGCHPNEDNTMLLLCDEHSQELIRTGGRG